MSFTSDQREFFKRGHVRVVVPRALDNVDGLSGSSTSILDIEQRDQLFIDERLRTFVVLQLPNCDEAELKAYLSRLTLGVEAWASDEAENHSRPGSNAAVNRDLIFSKHLKRDDDPVVLVTQGEDQQVYVNLVWEASVDIPRPRARLAEPRITIIPSASISPLPAIEVSDVYLEPFVAQEVNVFEPLRGAKGFEKDAPYMPASRLQIVLPPSAAGDPAFHFHSVSSIAFKVFPVTNLKLRYTKVWGLPVSTTLTASLDVDVVPHVDVEGTIEEITMTLASGTVEDLTKELLPLPCRAKDCITFLYNLQRQHSEFGNDTNLDVVTVSITLKLSLPDGCRPEIHTELVTNVDFAQTLGPPQTPVGQSLQRANRPPSLPLHTSTSISLQPRTKDDLLTISFSAPVRPVKVGQAFAWKVLVVNRSQSIARLAVVPLPRMQRPVTQAQQYARRHASKNSSISLKRVEKGQHTESEDVAQPAIDENIIYAMQHSGAAPIYADIISLTSELKVGPLLPGQCFEDEIRMVATKKGPCMVDAIRVVDLQRESEEGTSAPGVIVDVKDLPDILVED